MRYQYGRGLTDGIFKTAASTEAGLIRGQFAAELALKLKAEGFIPDLIIGHPDWGEMVFVGEVYPGVKQIQIGEWYHLDTGFDREFGASDFADRCLVHARNATRALSIVEADRIVSATKFQASTFPASAAAAHIGHP